MCVAAPRLLKRILPIALPHGTVTARSEDILQATRNFMSGSASASAASSWRSVTLHTPSAASTRAPAALRSSAARGEAAALSSVIARFEAAPRKVGLGNKMQGVGAV